MSGYGALAPPGDIAAAANSLVDLSHLQETVVWLVNQLHRHQDEIAQLQHRRDVDIPTLQAQQAKERHWMVQKSYKYFYHIASEDGFRAFKKEWQRAREERAKWNKASWHAAKMYTRKAHAVWFDVWKEEKRNRHVVRFVSRNIRRNRMTRAMGIWAYAWFMARQDRQIIATEKRKREEKEKEKMMAEFKQNTKDEKRRRVKHDTMKKRIEDRTKSKILAAWKFLVDFNFIQEHKLWSQLMRAAHTRIKLGFGRWKESTKYQQCTRRVVKRMTSKRTMKRLAAGFDDWCFATTLGHKEKIIAKASQVGTMELVETMEKDVNNIVSKPNVRPWELQKAAAYLQKIHDFKLHAALSQVHEALLAKVDKPTAEDIARRSRTSQQPSFSQQLAKNESAPLATVGSTMPSGPSAIKYTDTLNAIAEANEKAEKARQALEAQKKAALDKTKEPVIAVPEVVYPNLGTHYAVQAEKVAQEQAAAAKAAAEAAKAEAAVDKEMGAPPAGMPMSSTRRLLERQYRTEMKMKMERDMQLGASVYADPYAPPMPGAPPMSAAQQDLAVLEAADATARYMADERAMAAAMAQQQAGFGPPMGPGGPAPVGSLAAAREASMLLQRNLQQEGPQPPF